MHMKHQIETVNLSWSSCSLYILTMSTKNWYVSIVSTKTRYVLAVPDSGKICFDRTRPNLGMFGYVSSYPKNKCYILCFLGKIL